MDTAGLDRADGPRVASSRWVCGGALTLGVCSLVEWPVTLLVVAGTYLAARPGIVSAVAGDRRWWRDGQGGVT